MENDTPKTTKREEPLIFRIGNGPWLMRVGIPATPWSTVMLGERDIVLPQEIQAFYNAKFPR